MLINASGVRPVVVCALITSALTFADVANAASAPPMTVQLYVDADFGRHHKNYAHNGGELPNNISRMEDGYSDEISSIKVGKGIKLVLYGDIALTGPSLVLYAGDYKHLRDWNDTVTSFAVEKVDPDLPLIKLEYSDGDIQNIGYSSQNEFASDVSFLVRNGLVAIDVPDSYEVTLHQHPNYAGHKTPTALLAGRHLMTEFGLEDNVSSLKIEWKKYNLARTTIVKQTVKDDDNEPERIAANVLCQNDSSANFTCRKTITKGYEASYTTKWENSTSVGITSKTSVAAQAGVEGVASTTVEQSIALEVANTFTFGGEKSGTTTEQVSTEASVELGPRQSVIFDVLVTPVVIEYEVQYVYSPVDGKGSNKIVSAKIEVKKASQTQAIARDVADPQEPKAVASEVASPVAAAPASNPTNNLALNKTATQSSTSLNASASFAVNGNTTGTFSRDAANNDISHTNDGQDNWWQVDLGHVHEITRIVVWNRREVAWERLQNFYVMVSENPIEANSTEEHSFSGPHAFTSPEHPSMVLDGNKKGRHVRLFLKNSTNPLHLGEVQVFGR